MNRQYLGGGSAGEGYRRGIDKKVGDVENDESGVGDDIDVDGNRAGELAGNEVGFEPDVVSFGDGEFGKTRLAFELLHSRSWRS